MARPGQRLCHPSQNQRTLLRLLDPLSCARRVVGNLPSPVSLTHLSQHLCHHSQNPRTLLRRLDPLSHGEGLISMARPGQRLCHPGQSPRTLSRILDPLSHLLSMTKRSDHTTIFTHLISTFK